MRGLLLIAVAISLMVSLYYWRSAQADIPLPPALDERTVVGTWEGYIPGAHNVSVLTITPDKNATLVLAHSKGLTIFHSNKMYMTSNYLRIDLSTSDSTTNAGITCTREPFNQAGALRTRITLVGSTGIYYNEILLMYPDGNNGDKYYDTIVDLFKSARNAMTRELSRSRH